MENERHGNQQKNRRVGPGSAPRRGAQSIELRSGRYSQFLFRQRWAKRDT